VPAIADGLSWIVNKVGLLASHYGWSLEYVLDELDGAQGWVWYNFAIEHENKLHGGSEIKYADREIEVNGVVTKVPGKGYIQQECDLIKENAELKNKHRTSPAH